MSVTTPGIKTEPPDAEGTERNPVILSGDCDEVCLDRHDLQDQRRRRSPAPHPSFGHPAATAPAADVEAQIPHEWLQILRPPVVPSAGPSRDPPPVPSVEIETSSVASPAHSSVARSSFQSFYTAKENDDDDSDDSDDEPLVGRRSRTVRTPTYLG